MHNIISRLVYYYKPVNIWETEKMGNVFTCYGVLRRFKKFMHLSENVAWPNIVSHRRNVKGTCQPTGLQAISRSALANVFPWYPALPCVLSHVPACDLKKPTIPALSGRLISLSFDPNHRPLRPLPLSLDAFPPLSRFFVRSVRLPGIQDQPRGAGPLA